MQDGVLKELEDMMGGAGTGLPFADDLVNASISHGYNPYTARLQLLIDLEPIDQASRIDAFAASLTYESSGLGPFKTIRKAFSSATVLDSSLVRTTLAMNAPDRRPLRCQWNVIAMVRSGTEVQRWQQSGEFKQR